MSSVRQVAQGVVDQAIAGITNPSVGAELFSVANLLEGEKSLRRNLSDSGVATSARQEVVASLFGSKVSSETVAVVKAIVGTRWPSDAELVTAIEQAGASVILAAAEQGSAIDRVEEEIFYFSRLVDSQSELQMALSNPANSPAVKHKLVADLLSGQAHESTSLLVAQFVSHPRGRRIASALDQLSELAATRRNRLVATVTAAVALTATQIDRIAAALGRIYGRSIQVDAVVDSSVIGGVSVQVAGEVIDGTILTRLEQARRQLQA